MNIDCSQEFVGKTLLLLSIIPRTHIYVAYKNTFGEFRGTKIHRHESLKKQQQQQKQEN